MRLKHIVDRLSLTAWIRLVYERITLTRFTTLFMIIALVHCLVQIGLQTASLVFNRNSCRFIGTILDKSGEPRRFASVDDNVLYICDPLDTPGQDICFPITGPDPETDSDAILNGSSAKARNIIVSRSPHPDDREVDFGDDDGEDDKESEEGGFKDESDTDDADDGQDTDSHHNGENKDDKGDNDHHKGNEKGDTEESNDDVDDSEPGSGAGASKEINSATGLPVSCIAGLNWPEIAMDDARREDITFLVAQLWVFAISFVTILNESVPHLMTALVAHGLTVAWGAFQVSRTNHNKFIYKELIVQDLCGGKDVIPEFWSIRMNNFVPILVLNTVVFVMMLAVSYKLFGVYSRQTVKRVGSSNTMMRRYFVILLFSVFLQLSAFFAIVSSAIWVDMLCDSVLAQFTDFLTAYRVIFIIICVVIPPWVIIGWNTFRHENRLWALVFLLLGLAITVATSSMFASTAYKRLFDNFPFFAAVSIAAYVILVFTNVLAVLCRVNFGKGLPQYLMTEKNFDDASFVPVVVPSKQQRQSRFTSVIFPDKPITLTLNHEEIDDEPPFVDIKASDALTKVKSIGDLDPLETTPRTSLFERATRSLRTLSIVSPRRSKIQKSHFSTTSTSSSVKGSASGQGGMEYVIPALPKLLAPRVDPEPVAPRRQPASIPPPSLASASAPAPTPAYSKRQSPPVMPAVRPPGLDVQRSADGRLSRVRVRPPALNLGSDSNLSISAPNPIYLGSRWSPTTMATSTGTAMTSPSAASTVSYQPSHMLEARLGPGPFGPRVMLAYRSTRPGVPAMARSLPSNPRAFVGQR